MFLCNFPIVGEAADLLRTCWHTKKSAISWQQVVVMEFGKRYDTNDTTDFCPRQLVMDLLRRNRSLSWVNYEQLSHSVYTVSQKKACDAIYLSII